MALMLQPPPGMAFSLSLSLQLPTKENNNGVMEEKVLKFLSFVFFGDGGKKETICLIRSVLTVDAKR